MKGVPTSEERGCDADEDAFDGGGKGAVGDVVGGHVEFGEEV